MLIGYEHIMRGETKSLDIIAYDHGDAGRKQFKKNKHRFISKKWLTGKRNEYVGTEQICLWLG